MRKEVRKIAVVLVMLIALTFSIFAQGESEGVKPIKVGHLTYHTGAFADVGPWFDAITEFSLDIINEDPPLGRKLVAVNQDIGTIGEAQAARKLIEQDKVEVLLNPAHEYLSYRSWMLDYVKANDGPLMPSIHGAGIESKYGGTIEEPIMRGAPMDSGQAVAAVIKAKNTGAKRVVIVATEIEGSQLQLEAALKAAKALGLNVVDSFSVLPEKNSYRNEVQRISGVNPDTLLFFSQAQDGGTLVKQLAEAGMSLYCIGTSEWQGQAFPETVGEGALKSHKAVWITSFSYVDGPSWAWYEPRLKSSKYIDVVGDPGNSYNIQYTDTLLITALAIEKAGSTKASEWIPAMRAVAMAPGKVVNSYADGIAAIRKGEEINYEGLTGSFDWTDTGVVSGLFGIFEWQDGHLVQVDDVDDGDVLKYDSL